MTYACPCRELHGNGERMKRESKEPSADVVKTTMRVRRELWNAVLHHSIDYNLSLQEIVERSLESYLKKGGRK
jgi:hypothetical protein